MGELVSVNRPSKTRRTIAMIETLRELRGEKQIYTSEAIEFCERHGISSYVEEARTLVEECFPSRKALRLRLDEDPEENGQWIAIEVTIEQDADDFLEAYNRCISLWVKRIPTEALTIIRLSYN